MSTLDLLSSMVLFQTASHSVDAVLLMKVSFAIDACGDVAMLWLLDLLLLYKVHY